MRASPPIEIALNRFAVWRAAVAVLAIVCCAAIAAWVVSSRDQRALGALVAVAVATLGLVGAALASARMAPVGLRWDGVGWQLARGGLRPGEPVAGRLQVAIDLGFWMLLRFVADAAPRHRRVSWLAVQRRGLEGQWHGLRCAAYAPVPAADAP